MWFSQLMGREEALSGNIIIDHSLLSASLLIITLDTKYVPQCIAGKYESEHWEPFHEST